MCELRKILPGVNGQVSFYKKKTSYRNLTTVFRTLTTHIACELEDFFFKELFPYSGNISVFLVNLGTVNNRLSGNRLSRMTAYPE